jgi:NitT/TauT family transport system permease protein
MSESGWVTRLHLPTLGVGAGLVTVWSLLSWTYGAYVLPSPRAVLVGLVEIVHSGEVWRHTGASLARIAFGFGAAVLGSLAMGLAAFVSRTARGVVHDVLAVLNATSVFVWIVIAIIWFGLSSWAPIFTTFMITLPVVASNIVEGVENVDRRLLEMGDVYRLSGRQKFVAIVVPSTLPYLIAGMKIGFGLALKVSVVAEIFGVTSGIGYIMNYSREILATQMVFVWALVMILVMMATDKLVFEALSRRLTRWR